MSVFELWGTNLFKRSCDWHQSIPALRFRGKDSQQMFCPKCSERK